MMDADKLREQIKTLFPSDLPHLKTILGNIFTEGAKKSIESEFCELQRRGRMFGGVRLPVPQKFPLTAVNPITALDSDPVFMTKTYELTVGIPSEEEIGTRRELINIEKMMQGRMDAVRRADFEHLHDSLAKVHCGCPHKKVIVKADGTMKCQSCKQEGYLRTMGGFHGGNRILTLTPAARRQSCAHDGDVEKFKARKPVSRRRVGPIVEIWVCNACGKTWKKNPRYRSPREAWGLVS